MTLFDFGERTDTRVKGHSESEFAYLNSPQGARNQTVSAALIVPGLNAWNMGSLTPELFHNPWATHPLAPDCWALPQNIPNMTTSRYDKRPGKKSSEVIGIPTPWPPSWD